MSLELQTASVQTELRLFQGYDPKKKLAGLQAILGPKDVLKIQQLVGQVKISEALAKYISDLMIYSRKKIESRFATLSTRAGMDLAKAARSWAWLQGRHRFGSGAEPGSICCIRPGCPTHPKGAAGKPLWGRRLGCPLVRQSRSVCQPRCILRTDRSQRMAGPSLDGVG